MENLKEIRQRIDLCASGREVTLIGVVKRQPIEKVQALVDAGLGDLGVNYLQEGEELRQNLRGFDGRWHFIGQIQSRKAPDVSRYDLVHSLDREKVARGLAPNTEVLVEVNLGEEASKGGIREGELEPFLQRLLELGHRVRGLMALPPPLYPVEKRRPYFARLREALERYESCFCAHELSMGTSEDFEEAVKEGATMVRLGTCLFGPRSS